MSRFFNYQISGTPIKQDEEFIKNFKIPLDEKFVDIFCNLSFSARLFLLNGLDESILFFMKREGLNQVFSELDNRILRAAKNAKFDMSPEDENIWKETLSSRMFRNEKHREPVDDVDTIIELVKVEKHREWLSQSDSFISSLYGKYQDYEFDSEDEKDLFFNSVRKLDLSSKMTDSVATLLKREKKISAEFSLSGSDTCLEVVALRGVSFDLFKEENIKTAFRELYPEMIYVEQVMHRVVCRLNIKFKGDLEEQRKSDMLNIFSKTIFTLLCEEEDFLHTMSAVSLGKKIEIELNGRLSDSNVSNDGSDNVAFKI